MTLAGILKAGKNWQEKKKKKLKLRFNESVTVIHLPLSTAHDQWLSRFGIWKEAPFHDELWDGYTEKFRSKPLTQKELARANREYKWRRRLPPRLFRLMFERGKKGKKSLSKSKDEIAIAREIRAKAEAMNIKLAKELKEEAEEKERQKILKKKNRRSKPKSKLLRLRKPKSKEAIKEAEDESDLVRYTFTDSPELPLPEDDLHARTHSLSDLRKLNSLNLESVHNETLATEKKTIINAYETFEKELKKKNSANRLTKSFRSSVKEKNPTEVDSEISFAVAIEGKKVPISVRATPQIMRSTNLTSKIKQATDDVSEINSVGGVSETNLLQEPDEILAPDNPKPMLTTTRPLSSADRSSSVMNAIGNLATNTLRGLSSRLQMSPTQKTKEEEDKETVDMATKIRNAITSFFYTANGTESGTEAEVEAQTEQNLLALADENLNTSELLTDEEIRKKALQFIDSSSVISEDDMREVLRAELDQHLKQEEKENGGSEEIEDVLKRSREKEIEEVLKRSPEALEPVLRRTSKAVDIDLKAEDDLTKKDSETVPKLVVSEESKEEVTVPIPPERPKKKTVTSEKVDETKI